MEPTRLVYLEEMQRLDSPAHVLGVESSEDRIWLILDQTVFYPQGGGQPCDQGWIERNGSRFRVEEVRFLDGIVRHAGFFDGAAFREGEEVRCLVDAGRRLLHSRIHSAGHVVDMAVTELDLGWIPGKGYHFPQGPYVEYRGNLEGLDKQRLGAEIEKRANDLVRSGLVTRVTLMTRGELSAVCRFVPEYVPEEKPSRVVFYGDFGVPCGGTHVAALGEIESVTIRKIKQNGETVRVAYAVG
ncbi:MAG TPA: alanine--tRNA ligase-related protein [Thermoanaerobaculia bacterium]|nr:alanine--tRNA ligase-related protein [Thermoanaerobaculia bacterium]